MVDEGKKSCREGKERDHFPQWLQWKLQDHVMKQTDKQTSIIYAREATKLNNSDLVRISC